MHALLYLSVMAIFLCFQTSKFGSQLSLAPDVLRLLTELFLCVENLSQEWGQSEELMMGTLSSQELHRWLEKGVSNVAYLSIALGLDNLAAKTFMEERVGGRLKHLK